MARVKLSKAVGKKLKPKTPVSDVASATTPRVKETKEASRRYRAKRNATLEGAKGAVRILRSFLLSIPYNRLRTAFDDARLAELLDLIPLLLAKTLVPGIDDDVDAYARVLLQTTTTAANTHGSVFAAINGPVDAMVPSAADECAAPSFNQAVPATSDVCNWICEDATVSSRLEFSEEVLESGTVGVQFPAIEASSGNDQTMMMLPSISEIQEERSIQESFLVVPDYNALSLYGNDFEAWTLPLAFDDDDPKLLDPMVDLEQWCDMLM